MYYTQFSTVCQYIFRLYVKINSVYYCCFPHFPDTRTKTCSNSGGRCHFSGLRAIFWVKKVQLNNCFKPAGSLRSLTSPNFSQFLSISPAHLQLLRFTLNCPQLPRVAPNCSLKSQLGDAGAYFGPSLVKVYQFIKFSLIVDNWVNFMYNIYYNGILYGWAGAHSKKKSSVYYLGWVSALTFMWAIKNPHKAG